MGTTGTIMGVSRYLKEQNPAVTIVGLQPAKGAAIAGALPGAKQLYRDLRHMPSAIAEAVSPSSDIPR
jgi:cysteine synthase